MFSKVSQGIACGQQLLGRPRSDAGGHSRACIHALRASAVLSGSTVMPTTLGVDYVAYDSGSPGLTDPLAPMSRWTQQYDVYACSRQTSDTDQSPTAVSH